MCLENGSPECRPWSGDGLLSVPWSLREQMKSKEKVELAVASFYLKPLGSLVPKVEVQYALYVSQSLSRLSLALTSTDLSPPICWRLNPPQISLSGLKGS